MYITWPNVILILVESKTFIMSSYISIYHKNFFYVSPFLSLTIYIYIYIYIYI